MPSDHEPVRQLRQQPPPAAGVPALPAPLSWPRPAGPWLACYAFAECFTGHRAAPSVRPRSPMYSLSGLMSRLSACCSITCAVQPGHPARREDRGEQVSRDTQVVVDRGGEEVDVRVQALFRQHDLFHPARHPVVRVVAAGGGELGRHPAKVSRPRVLGLIHPVPEAHDLLAPASRWLTWLLTASSGSPPTA